LGSRVAAVLLFLASVPALAAQIPPSQLAKSDAEAEGEVVADVELHLPPGADASGLAELIDVRRGQRLSVRAVRRSIERLFATGRMADVVVRSVRTPSGITLIYDLTPKRRIGAVDVKGNHVLSRTAVRDASGLLPGSEYYPERLDQAEQAVVLAYQRRGYYRTHIRFEFQQSAEGLDVLLTVDEGPPTRMAGISVAGQPGLPLWQIQDAIGLGIGSILDGDRLDAGIEKLKSVLRTDQYYRAKLGQPIFLHQEDGAVVALPVDAGPRYAIHFHGNRSFRDRVLFAILNYDGSESLDRALIARMTRQLTDFYRYRGFYDVRVLPRDTWSPDQTNAVLSFNIEEGLPLTLKNIIFEGNRNVSTGELRDLLLQNIRANTPIPHGDVHPTDDPLDLEGRTATAEKTSEPDPDASAVFVEDAYLDAAQNMTQLYKDRGFLDAKVTLSAFDLDIEREVAQVRFEIVEGVQTVVREISYARVPAGVLIVNDPRLTVGSGLSAAAIEQTRSSIARALARSGYIFARVTDSTAISADRKDARVLFRVEPGPSVRVGKIIIQGLNRTNEGLVRANLAIQSGNVLDPENLFDTQRNLALLGIFRNVGVRLIEPDVAEATKDVVVELKERSRLDGNFFFGFSLVEGPSIGVDALYPNLFGHGVNLSGRLKVNFYRLAPGLNIPSEDLQGLNGFGGSANIALHQPRLYSLLPAKVGWRVDLVGERVFRPYYRFTRFAAIPGIDWTVFKWLTVSLQYELEYDRVQTSSGVLSLLPSLARVDQERLRFPIGRFTLQSLRPSMTIDFRDDPLNPHKGFFLSGYTEVTHDISAYPTDINGNPLPPFPIFTLKVAGNLTFYVPISSRVVLAVSGRAGKIFQLEADSQSIAPKRFYLGGTTTIRGFREDGIVPQDRRDQLHEEVANCRALINQNFGCTQGAAALVRGQEVPSEGGELFNLARTELRFPVVGAWDLGFFFEAGNLWLSPSSYHFSLSDLRYGAGAGVRYLFPIGPAALDVGFNLEPDNVLNESVFQIHFSIGVF
jgi:outer membrane protein assembly factor BamA